MSAPDLPEVAVTAMVPDCARCSFHGFACPRHSWEALEQAQASRAQLEHQVAVLTVALAQAGGKAVA